MAPEPNAVRADSALAGVEKRIPSHLRRSDGGSIFTSRIVHILDGLAAGVIMIDERFEISYSIDEAERMFGVVRHDDSVEHRLVVSAGRDPQAGSVEVLMVLEDARR